MTLMKQMASWIARLVSLVEVLTGTQGGVCGGREGGGRGPREMCAGGGVREWGGGGGGIVLNTTLSPAELFLHKNGEH